ncbi:YbhN family protein [Kutzneria sp. NPDC052558]|uniref:YbhN family protein n=1 Tax=Kutzneria sp. NPDC052558 TaxID=3364121 RepID=UPI0037C68110
MTLRERGGVTTQDRRSAGIMRLVWPWVKILAGVVIIGILLWRLGTGAFVDGLSEINLWGVAAALGIGLLTTVFSAWRWCVVADQLGLKLSLRTAVADYYQALFINAVLPGGVLGDVHRAVQNGHDTGDVGRGVRAVVLERTGGQLAILAVGAGVLLTDPSLIGKVIGDIVPAPAAIVIGVLLVVAAAIVLAISSRRPRWRQAVAKTVLDIRRSLLSRKAWPAIVLLSVATLAGHLSLFLVAARAAGSTASIGQLLPLLVLALIAMGLPINVGGWGPREGVAALAFAAAGLGATQGVTTAVVYGVLTLISSLPGAAVLVLRRVRRPASTSAPVASDDLVTSNDLVVPAESVVPAGQPAREPVAIIVRRKVQPQAA